MFFGDIMMGARSRLLPASLPFRFFGTALLMHVAAWAILALGAAEAPGFMGGPGPVLASLHLLTLGVLAMTAIGASYQLLPVATKRPVRSETLCRVSYWLFVPGVLVLSYGLGTGTVAAMHAGGAMAVGGLAIYGFLLADNLSRVSDMPVVTRHAWTAVAGLAALAVLGLMLLADFSGGFLPDRRPVAAAHAVAAGFGYMGMLALGLSYILVPMFALSRAQKDIPGKLSAMLAAAALVVAVAGALAASRPLLMLGGVAGLGAMGVYLWAMHQAMKTRMRRQLGGSFVLVRVAWALMPASVVVGLLLVLDVRPEVTAPLFGFLLLYGWLLTFLTGVLQRIMPFLASMHSVGAGRKPVLVSALVAERPLRIHLWCHLAALALVASGLVLGLSQLILAGALAGAAGAVAFATFGALLWRRMVAHLNANPPSESKS